jgi:hypothetical protein
MRGRTKVETMRGDASDRFEVWGKHTQSLLLTLIPIAEVTYSDPPVPTQPKFSQLDATT